MRSCLSTALRSAGSWLMNQSLLRSYRKQGLKHKLWVLIPAVSFISDLSFHACKMSIAKAGPTSQGCCED